MQENREQEGEWGPVILDRAEAQARQNRFLLKTGKGQGEAPTNIAETPYPTRTNASL